MRKFPVMLIAAIPAMSACSDSDNSSVGVTQVENPTTTASITLEPNDLITVSGNYTLSSPTGSAIDGEEFRVINGNANTNNGRATVFTGENTIIAAGFDTGSQQNFGAVNGTTAAIPAGSVQYVGHYTVITGEDRANPNVPGNDAATLTDTFSSSVTTSFSLADMSLTGTSDDGLLDIDATVNNDGQLGGTITFDDGTTAGSTATVTGGIYGSDAGEVAGAFTNVDLGGYFYGQR